MNLFDEKTKPVNGKSLGNDIDTPTSASDQIIVIRYFAQPVPMEFDGEEYMITPPSFWLSNVIRKFRMDYLKILKDELKFLHEGLADMNKDLVQKIKKLDEAEESSIEQNETVVSAEEISTEQSEPAAITEEKPVEPEKNKPIKFPHLSLMLDVYNQRNDIMMEIAGKKDEFMMRYAQLILLDAKNPEWKKTAKGFPSQKVLDEGITRDRLEKFVGMHEIDALISVYEQMNKPNVPRKNFEGVGANLL